MKIIHRSVLSEYERFVIAHKREKKAMRVATVIIAVLGTAIALWIGSLIPRMP